MKEEFYIRQLHESVKTVLNIAIETVKEKNTEKYINPHDRLRIVVKRVFKILKKHDALDVFKYKEYPVVFSNIFENEFEQNLFEIVSETSKEIINVDNVEKWFNFQLLVREDPNLLKSSPLPFKYLRKPTVELMGTDASLNKLILLSDLYEPFNEFMEKCLVNSENKLITENRINLIKQIHICFVFNGVCSLYVLYDLKGVREGWP